MLQTPLDGYKTHRGDGIALEVTIDGEALVDAEIRLLLAQKSPTGKLLGILSRSGGNVVVQSETATRLEITVNIPPSITQQLPNTETIVCFEAEVTPSGGVPTTRQGSFTVLPAING